jgi:hypothetical protein
MDFCVYLGILRQKKITESATTKVTNDETADFNLVNKLLK